MSEIAEFPLPADATDEERATAKREIGKYTKIVGDTGVVRVTPDLAAMDVVAAELAERQVDIVAVCGGDGSQFRALSAIRKAQNTPQKAKAYRIAKLVEETA